MSLHLESEIRRIFSPFDPERIILFGSRARSDSDPHSDVDLIVVYRTDKRFLDRLDELYARWDLPLAVDILAYTPDEFARLVQTSALVAHAAATGKVLVEAA